MNRGAFVGSLLVYLVVLSSTVLALEGTHIIVNSENWKDVYSSMLYASLSGRAHSFLTSTSYGPIILDGISTENSIGVITSTETPFIINYPSLIRPRGYQGVDEIEVDEANIELIDEPELVDIDSFIILGDAYGYNSIAVAPYATLTRSWVFFANRINIAEIEAILERRNPEKILVYGYVDREVRESLARFNPTTINTGDRFEDNVEIVKVFKKEQEAVQVTLTNGEFLEQEIMNSRHPILFTGRQNVPDKIAEYLRESDIEVGVLIGNELIQAATNIRRTAGIAVMVKFARSARTPGPGVSQVQGLDLFPLPTPSLNLEIQSVTYNKLSSQIEITYQSKSNVPLYLKGTLTIRSGGETQRIGDADPIYMAPNDYKTISYSDVRITSEEGLTAEINTLFGEVPTSLDRELTGTIEIDIINVLDKCEIEVKKVTYVKQAEEFKIKIKNTADVECYADIELEEVVINGVEQVIGTEGSEQIRSGDTKNIRLIQRMDEQDLRDNPFINLKAYYGERETALVKMLKGKYELNIDLFSTLTYMMIVLFILLILLLLIIFFIRRRDEEW